MNNKGFGLKEFIIIISVVFIGLIVAGAIYQRTIGGEITGDKSTPKTEDRLKSSNKTVKKEESTYKRLESKLRQAAMSYQSATYQTTETEDVTMVLTSKFLQKKGYLKELHDPVDNSVCEGYVIFRQRQMAISYTPYLKCNNFKTDGFDNSKMN